MVLKAASAGKTGLLDQAWHSGASLFVRGDDGSTVLHCAARAGHASTVRYLLNIGLSPEVQNEKGRNPLHEAILGRDLNTLSALLQEDPDIHKTDMHEKTAVDYLIGYFNSSMGRLFVEHLSGSQINAGPKPVLHLASAVGHVEFVEIILSHAAVDVNRMCSDGYTPLHIAARNGHYEITQKLVAHKSIDIHAVGGIHTVTPLRYAAQYGHHKVAQILVTTNDTNTNRGRDEEIALALRYAAIGGYDEVIKIFLALDTLDINYRIDRPWESKRSATDEAIARGHCSTALLLLGDRRHEVHNPESCTPRFAKDWAFRTAAALNDTSIVTLLLQDPTVRINYRQRRRLGGHGKEGFWTALHYAVYHANLELINRLLEHTWINVNASDFRSNTPLHLGAELGHIKVTTLLMQHKTINVNETNVDGQTPLHKALLQGHVELAKQLLEDDRVDVNIRANFRSSERAKYSYDPNETALDIARRKGQTEIIDILLSRGATSTQEKSSAVAEKSQARSTDVDEAQIIPTMQFEDHLSVELDDCEMLDFERGDGAYTDEEDLLCSISEEDIMDCIETSFP